MPCWRTGLPCRRSAPAHAPAPEWARPRISRPACRAFDDAGRTFAPRELATRELNAPYLTVMLEGKYTDGLSRMQPASDAPQIHRRRVEDHRRTVDFVGLNIYAPHLYVAASDRKPGWTALPFPASFPHMNSRWLRIGPEAIYWAPRLAAKRLEPR